MNFQNKTVIVTGGTGALGSAVTSRFFDAGAYIAIPYHRLEAMMSLPKKMRDAADHLLLMQTDLASEEQVVEFVDHVLKKFGKVHCVVNVAGGYAGGKGMDAVSVAEWDAMMTLNLKTAFLMCRYTVGLMKAQHFGRIVNIAAMPALTSGAKKGPYAISKRGVVTLTEVIAEEVKGTGVTANAIAPGVITTENNKASMPDADFAKWVSPGEIAEVILFLCSDVARSINGNVIKVFGGL